MKLLAVITGLLTVVIGAICMQLPSATESAAAETSSPHAGLSGEKRRSPDRNTAPLAYVGRQVCGECHQENFSLHAAHGHAHTFAAADEPEIAEHFAGRSYHDEQRGTYTYHLGDEGLFVRMPEKFGEMGFPLQYALGSGHNGITLLSLLPDANNETVAFEHRASWYRHRDQLAPTPGQKQTAPETAADLFGQKHVGKVMEMCIDCHTTTAEIINHSIKNLQPNVNCEKCHGPGSEHVRQARLTDHPPPFSVGKADWDTESEIQLCGSCHRLPANVSREELRQYPDPLTRFQPIGMLRSECYLQSEGRLKCTTCHNPHTSVTATPARSYVETCIDCHRQDDESHIACPVSPTEGCIDCHMPKVELDNPGLAFHDHWIRIRGAN